MRIYTYFQSLPGCNIEENLRLLNLWRNHHNRLGYTPCTLQEWHAWRSPDFKSISDRVSKLPSINPDGYDRACYLRWLAMGIIERGIMMDYDTFIYEQPAKFAERIKALPQDKISVLQGVVPCLVHGTGKQFVAMAKRFANYTPDGKDLAEGRPHTSDMMILERIAAVEPEAFDRFDVVKLMAEEGWNTAPAVHFSNACMTPKNFQPRWKHIPGLRAI